MKHPRNVSAIILAGGLSSRVGKIGQIVPKCLLPVSRDETLLTRLINQLNEIKPEEIIISTSERQFEILSAAVRNIDSRGHNAPPRVILNPLHVLGPGPALGYALQQTNAALTVTCLSDIFFEHSPFRNIGNTENITLICSPLDSFSGGVVEHSKGVVSGLIYSRAEFKPDPAKSYHNWTGASIIGSHAKWTVENCCNVGSAPLEHLFIRSICSGITVRLIETGYFRNINTFDDYRRCLCREETAVSLP